MPTFRFEKAAVEQFPPGPVVGIDEAGMAPLAGPVVAGAVILDQDKLPRKLRRELKDSKQVIGPKREELFALLYDCGAAIIGVGVAEVHEIESFNILNASHRAMARAYEGLKQQVAIALVDGNRKPPLPCAVQTIVDGDTKSLSIAAASILAKVTRDRIMVNLAAQHPGYGWETNVGYGTPEHLAALARLGLTAHHRRTYAPVRAHICPSAVQNPLPLEELIPTD